MYRGNRLSPHPRLIPKPDALPVRAGYTIELDIKPEQIAEQIILIHHGYYIGSIILKLNKSNELYGAYCTKELKVNKFNSGIKLEQNKWNKVKIIYDLKNIWFEINGKKSEKLPCPGPGLYTGTFVLGGFGQGDKDVDFTGKPSWFKGKSCVGIASGASTPDWVIQKIIKEIEGRKSKK